MLKKVIPATIGAAVSLAAVMVTPSYAATITSVSLQGLGQNTGTISLSGQTITVAEIFNNPNTISKVLNVSPGPATTYTFNVQATNNTNLIWDSFRFNLNASGNPNNRPTFVEGTFNSNAFLNAFVDINQDFLEFSGGSVNIGQTVNFAFSVLAPAGFNPGSGQFDIDERPFGTQAGTPIPTPALLPGLLAMGVGALRKRKGEQETGVEAEA